MAEPSLAYCDCCRTVRWAVPGASCCDYTLLPLPVPSLDKYALSYAVMVERQRCIALISEHADGNDGVIGDVAPLLMKIANP